MTTISLKPTWCEWGNIYTRLAESGQIEAIRQLRKDLAKALSAAEAINHIELTPEQKECFDKVMREEMRKMGFSDESDADDK